MPVQNWKEIADVVTNLGLVPTLLIVLLFYVVRQNRDLHRQNMALLDKMMFMLGGFVDKTLGNERKNTE